MRSGYVSVAHVDTDVNAYAEQPAADLAHLVRVRDSWLLLTWLGLGLGLGLASGRPRPPGALGPWNLSALHPLTLTLTLTLTLALIRC